MARYLFQIFLYICPKSNGNKLATPDTTSTLVEGTTKFSTKCICGTTYTRIIKAVQMRIANQINLFLVTSFINSREPTADILKT